VGVFEIGHKTVCARVQGVDDHLAIRRPSDFHSAILEIRGHGLNLPGTGTNIFGFFEEAGHFTAIQSGLTFLTQGQKLQTSWIELALQGGKKRERFGRKNLAMRFVNGAKDYDAGWRMCRLHEPTLAAAMRMESFHAL